MDSIKSPTLDGSHFYLWKTRMRTCVNSISDEARHSIETEWSLPCAIVDDVVYKKFDNSKVQNIVCRFVDSSQYIIIENCTAAYDAWRTL